MFPSFLQLFLQRIQDRDERKQAHKEKKEEETTLKLLEVIKVKSYGKAFIYSNIALVLCSV